MNRRRQLENHSKKNLSRAFVLPMCGINYKILPDNFINCYIDTNLYKVFIVFDKLEDYDEDCLKFIKNVKENNKTYSSYQEDLDEIVLEFDIPDKYHDDFYLFVEGKYSKFSLDYKSVLMKYFGTRGIAKGHKVNEFDTIYPKTYKKLELAKVLYDKKDITEGVKNIVEVLEAPDIEKETFKTLTELLETINLNNDNNNYELNEQNSF